VRVLSLGQAWSGTFGTELLALLGADVVQIGGLQRIDVWRRVRNAVPRAIADASRVQHPANTQGLANSVNLNKREIALDLSRQRGRDLFWRLIPRFDVLAENFRPTVMPAWGVTLERLHALRPGMVWASISAYGAEGPYREYPGNGSTTEPMSGFSSLHGYEGDPGMNSGGLYPDPVAAYCFAASVVAALAHRDRTGEPQRVDLSMVEAVTAVCGDAIVEYDATGRLPRPRGNRHPRVAPHNNYPAADGEWIAIAAESEAAWRALVAHLGDARLAEARFATMAARKANEAALDALIAGWTAGRHAGETEAALGALGVTAARVVPFYELYSRPDPFFAASGFVTRVDHPEAGPTWLPGRPWRFSAAPSSPVTGAPCVGQHSREILSEELGITDREYADLVAEGITGTLDDVDRPREQTRAGAST
jgi:crotonobetainyl-CoA:carnitine CoA-transferase CaiB-like acyl-CoA transferase